MALRKVADNSGGSHIMTGTERYKGKINRMMLFYNQVKRGRSDLMINLTGETTTVDQDTGDHSSLSFFIFVCVFFVGKRIILKVNLIIGSDLHPEQIHGVRDIGIRSDCLGISGKVSFESRPGVLSINVTGIDNLQHLQAIVLQGLNIFPFEGQFSVGNSVLFVQPFASEVIATTDSNVVINEKVTSRSQTSADTLGDGIFISKMQEDALAKAGIEINQFLGWLQEVTLEILDTGIVLFHIFLTEFVKILSVFMEFLQVFQGINLSLNLFGNVTSGTSNTRPNVQQLFGFERDLSVDPMIQVGFAGVVQMTNLQNVFSGGLATQIRADILSSLDSVSESLLRVHSLDGMRILLSAGLNGA
mmetsp:Transcript_27757/g.31911  ORF Transcript_27757/g.31911 Transcript_27757/m.31911 type:complete len:360 (-) Transcript_27757:94-1173(-)